MVPLEAVNVVSDSSHSLQRCVLETGAFSAVLSGPCTPVPHSSDCLRAVNESLFVSQLLSL